MWTLNFSDNTGGPWPPVFSAAFPPNSITSWTMRSFLLDRQDCMFAIKLRISLQSYFKPRPPGLGVIPQYFVPDLASQTFLQWHVPLPPIGENLRQMSKDYQQVLLDVRRSLRRFPPGEKLSPSVLLHKVSVPVALTFLCWCLPVLGSFHPSTQCDLIYSHSAESFFNLLHHTQTPTETLSQK